MAGNNEYPFRINSIVFFVVTEVQEILVIFVLPTTPIRNIINFGYARNFLFDEFVDHRLDLMNKASIMCVIIGNETKRVVLQISLFVFVIDDKGM